ncbi:septation protein A [Sneathiella glossodoripedis]|uniref:septation protein A n=1 Tax=Sneathiella glossodoripedis TaxID=418853 RepID=UPI000471E2D5|nr:septation protein A [Sneathiella glossodoripedis]
MSTRKMPQSIKTATELGPIVIFFAAYYLYDLYVATGAIMATTLGSLIVSYAYEKRIPAMPLVTAVVVTIFGGLTLYLNDDTFIKMKPTIIYALFAAALAAGLLLGKSFVKTLFGNFWDLSDTGWHQLTVRLTLFFLSLAVVNEIVWRNFSTDFWVNVKVFGFTGITFVFFMAQVPLLTKHSTKSEDSPEE